jgi:signal transduction histidine kinase
MWFGTDYGVFSLSGGRLQHLNTHDGLAADIVERALVDHDGNVWFGTHGGVSRVDRVRVKQEIPIPSVYLALVTAGDNERPFSSGSLIEYEERTVAFRYNALSYVDETSMLFQWKLEGFDADWQAPQRQRQVRYTNLNPGQYTFAVRAANRNGSWSLPARFVMAIAPPFWQTWWFILVVVAVVVSVLSVAYRYRVRQLLNVERMRTRIAADLHDDIASSLSSVALYSDVIQRELQDAPEEVRMLLHRIRDISREVMESIGLIVWAVDPRRDELAQVFHYFQRHATQLCSAAGIEFACHLQEGIEAVRLTPDHRRTIFLIFKEALNNTVRHSGCSRVEFACTMNDHVLEIALNDNGRGFRLDGDIHGHGLQSMRARAAGIGAEIEINSQPGHGTALRARVRMA